MKPIILLGLLALGGCAQMEARQEAARVAELQKLCGAIPKTQGHFVERANCLNDAIYKAGVFPTPATNLLVAERLRLATEIDAGKINYADASVQLAELAYHLQQDAAADQQRKAANAAMILSAMPRPQPYVTQPYQIPVSHPWTAKCTTMGAYTSCTGN